MFNKFFILSSLLCLILLSYTSATQGRSHIGDDEFSDDASSKCKPVSVSDLDNKYRESWACKISHVNIGPASNLTNSEEVNGRAIFDLRYNYISLPESYIDYFRQNYILSQDKLKNCEESINRKELIFTCTISKNDLVGLSPINFIFDGIAYSPDPKYFFMMMDENKYELLVRFNNYKENIWILGQPFLSQYTVVFGKNHLDFFGGNKARISIWPTEEYSRSNESDESDAPNISTESGASKEDQMFYIIVAASSLGALLILVLFIVIHSIRRNRLQEEHGPLVSLENF